MSVASDPTWGLIEAFRVGAQAFLDALPERTDGTWVADHFAKVLDPKEPSRFDPLRDDPPFPPDPRPTANKAQQNLATVIFLGAIGRINAEHGRGANSEEVAEFAKKAGYSRGNAVNGWTSRDGSVRAIELDDNQGRWLNTGGLDAVNKHAKALKIELIGEFHAVQKPGDE